MGYDDMIGLRYFQLDIKSQNHHQPEKKTRFKKNFGESNQILSSYLIALKPNVQALKSSYEGNYLR